MVKAIPDLGNPAMCVRIDFKESGFVELHDNAVMEIKMQYPLLHMDNAEERCFVRHEVAILLEKASKLLPHGYKFRIYDAWRSLALQKELYSKYSEKIIRHFGLKDCTNEQRERMIHRYVSMPEANRQLPPVHTTGGALDLTLLDAEGEELDMGTEFDAFTEKAHTCYYEGKENSVFRDNRRLLYHIMTSVGFTNLPTEWWHFDYGDRFWGYYTDMPAIYSGVFKREDMNE